MAYLKKFMGWVVCAASLIASISTAQAADTAARVINIAYQTTYSPWIAPVASGAIEKATGYKIQWRKFSSGAAVMSAMASGNIDIGVLGSSPIATAASRGMDIQLFWVLEDIANAEALMVRNDANIKAPQDLAGKTIAVPFASTSHYQLMYVLDKWGVTDKVKLVNMTPEQAAAAWVRGDIDGAFIWGPSLALIKRTGQPMVTAGQICEMGRCTFEGMAVRRQFAVENRAFMSKLVETLETTNQDFRNRPSAWGASSKNVSDIVKFLGGSAEDAVEEMALYRYPTLADQASCRWLGCGAQGEAAKTLLSTAKFLKQQNKIDMVLPNYSGAVTSSHVEAAAEAARK